MSEEFDPPDSAEQVITILSEMPSHLYKGPTGASALRTLMEHLGSPEDDCLVLGRLAAALSVELAVHMYAIAHWLIADLVERKLVAWLSSVWLRDPAGLLGGLAGIDGLVVRDAARSGLFRRACITETALCRAVLAEDAKAHGDSGESPRLQELADMLEIEGAVAPEKQEERGAFSIFLKVQGSTHTLEGCTAFTSVCTLKARVERRVGIPEVYQRFVFQGRLLHDSTYLGRAGVRRDSTIYLTVDPHVTRSQTLRRIITNTCDFSLLGAEDFIMYLRRGTIVTHIKEKNGWYLGEWIDTDTGVQWPIRGWYRPSCTVPIKPCCELRVVLCNFNSVLYGEEYMDLRQGAMVTFTMEEDGWAWGEQADDDTKSGWYPPTFTAPLEW